MDKRVCIDAGHGGKDAGATGGGVRECDVALAVARQVAMFLPEDTTMQTRGNDTFVALGDRARAANAFCADAFVSLHCNGAVSEDATGFEVWVHPQASARARQLAKTVYETVLPISGLRGRGVKSDNFAVLRETKMPAILIELGFITNAGDRAKLTDAAWQTKMARAIAYAVKEAL